MLFNSPEYLVFFIVTLSLSWLTVGLPKLRMWLLLLASYYFYISNNHWLILLIVVSTQIDYVAGLAIAKSDDPKRRKRWLVLSLVTNLGILGYFKYFNFFAGSISDLASMMGLQLGWVDLNILLPVGISFYTFQSMSYTIDVYRGVIEVERSWIRFAFFVSFFPQLIAGPIVRASEFLDQTRKRPQLDAQALSDSLYLIISGLIKKIVLADFVARYADAAFTAPGQVDTVGAWLGVYSFTLQIYFDFSGYTDIAIGSARLMGYHLPVNFRQPYMSTCITDFWRRWHISLSTWLRDYLYISLGGNRMSTRWGVYRNLMLTMLLGGLWHGAAWNFVIWGALHGGLLSLERALGIGREKQIEKRWGAKRWLRSVIMFNVAALLWVPFRADDVGTMMTLLGRLVAFQPPEFISIGMVIALAIIIGGFVAQYVDGRWGILNLIEPVPHFARALAYGIAFAVIVVFNSAGAQPFIYFRF